MIKRLVLNIISSVLGLFIADYFLAGLEVSGGVKAILIAGALLGLANIFIKPLLNLVFFPLKVITLNFFSLIINLAIIWLIIDVLMTGSMEINGLIPLFWTSLIIWLVNIIANKVYKN